MAMRPFASILCIIALAVLACPAPASPVLEASGSLSLPMVGDTATVALNLTGAETGFSGYNISLIIFPSETAEIMSVSFPSWASIPLNGTMPAENTWIQTIDLEMEVEPGASPVSLGLITVQAVSEGEGILTIIPSMVDDDQGGRYTLDSVRIPVRVGAVTTASTSSDVPSTDEQVSSSSSSPDVPTPGAATEPDDAVQPVVTQVSNATANPTSPVSDSPDSSFREQEMQPTNEAPGFGCFTFCLAGILFCALSVLFRNGR